MALDEKDLEKVARLAHLNLTPSKKATLLTQLNGILDQVATINCLDLDAVSPMTSVVEQGQFLREDCPTVSLTTADLEQNAPVFEDGAFRVPKITASTDTTP